MGRTESRCLGRWGLGRPDGGRGVHLLKTVYVDYSGRLQNAQIDTEGSRAVDRSRHGPSPFVDDPRADERVEVAEDEPRHDAPPDERGHVQVEAPRLLPAVLQQ